MNAAEILAIPLTEPERLFFSADIIAARFKALAMDWHPDRGGDAKVFAHINVLKAEAEKKAAAGIWETPGLLELRSVGGTKLILKFKKRMTVDVGEMLIGRASTAFLVKSAYKDLARNGLFRLAAKWKFPSKEIEEINRKFIPVVAAQNETPDCRVVVFVRAPNDILARDLLAHLGGKMDPRHVAWVISSLMNAACLFEYNGIAHNGITMDTVFISPEFHSAFPVGGWWYGQLLGHEVKYLPPALVRLKGLLKDKKADGRLDREAIRTVALTLLGDASGHTLVLDKAVPKPMLTYLRMPATRTAVEDYAAWEKARDASFGPRKFVDLPVKGSEIYT